MENRLQFSKHKQKVFAIRFYFDRLHIGAANTKTWSPTRNIKSIINFMIKWSNSSSSRWDLLGYSLLKVWTMRSTCSSIVSICVQKFTSAVSHFYFVVDMIDSSELLESQDSTSLRVRHFGIYFFVLVFMAWFMELVRSRCPINNNTITYHGMY